MIDVAARLICEPAPSALTPKALRPVAVEVVPKVEIVVCPVALMTPPPPAKSPIEPLPAVLNTFEPLSAASELAPFTTTAGASLPAVETVTPRRFAVPPPSTKTATGLTPATSTSPSVAIVVPATETDEPEPRAATPNEPSPVVVTLPPLKTTLPPEALTTPGASTPLVTIEMPLVVIVDPTSEAKTPIEKLPVVIMLGATDGVAVSAVIAPPSVAKNP